MNLTHTVRSSIAFLIKLMVIFIVVPISSLVYANNDCEKIKSAVKRIEDNNLSDFKLRFIDLKKDGIDLSYWEAPLISSSFSKCQLVDGQSNSSYIRCNSETFSSESLMEKKWIAVVEQVSICLGSKAKIREGVNRDGTKFKRAEIELISNNHDYIAVSVVQIYPRRKIIDYLYFLDISAYK